MAAERELNARARKCVYMHSTIFDTGGPTSKSIYAQNQQQDIYNELNNSLRKAGPPPMDLPCPSDIQCTQNAGHGVVIPSNIGVDRRGRQPQSSAQFRSSGPEALVTDGNVMPVLQSGYKDATIPQEFWHTDVNLQWHDPRNELSRQNKNRNKELGAQELKLQELSSEIFGKARIKNCSTENPGADLLSSEADYLQHDSALNLNLRSERQQVPFNQSAFDRKSLNLANSNQNTLTQADQGPPVSITRDEDPSSMPRRRQEKNFSDLFDTQMGERRQIQGREEVIGTRTCSFLDTRSEIAARNTERWRPAHSDLQGSDIREHANVSTLRKEAEQGSQIFNRAAPQKPRANTDEAEVTGNERVCWDTKDIMQPASEIARRARLKEFEVVQSAQDRKWGGLASQQVRKGIGADAPRFDDPGSSPRRDRLTDPRAPPLPRSPVFDRPQSAKDCKLASLQSSIFG